MKKKATGKNDLASIRAMAEMYGVAENALFLSTLDAYEVQKKAIEKIKAVMEEDDPTTTKEYVKGRENIYLHPALKELPRHADSLNKTADMLLKIITSLGTVQQEEDELTKHLSGGVK